MKQVSSDRQMTLVRRAERILRDENLLELPVNLLALARTREISVKEMKSEDNGASGMLLRHGDVFGILYSTRIHNKGFQRFSIAHELGHFFIEGHLDHIPFDCNMHRSQAGFNSEDYYEREADHFAAGLLMPTAPTRKIVEEIPAGLGGIKAVQQKTHTSLTAAAIRYVGLTDEAVTIIVSHKGVIDYCFMSSTMKQLDGIDWLRKGMQIPTNTFTRSVLDKSAGEQQSARTDGELDITTWFGGQRYITAREEVTRLGTSGLVLTVLTLPGFVVDEDPDEDSDEALEERWTPRFRR